MSRIIFWALSIVALALSPQLHEFILTTTSNPAIASLSITVYILVAVVNAFAAAIAKDYSKFILNRLFMYPYYYRRQVITQVKFGAKYLQSDGLSMKGLGREVDKVYVPLKLKLLETSKVSAAAVQKYESKKAINAKHIWHFLQSEKLPRLSIAAAPGFGKTTILKHIALQFLDRRKLIRNRFFRRPKLPIIIQLRKYTSQIKNDQDVYLSTILRDALFSHTKDGVPVEWFDYVLQGGQLLIMFDGLDEVTPRQTRKKVADWIDNNILSYQSNWFIITSRPNGLLDNDQPLTLLNHFTELALIPLDNTQQKDVIYLIHRMWRIEESKNPLARINPKINRASSQSAQELISEINNNQGIADLATNPLLLRMITDVSISYDELPDSLFELYEKIAKHLLWDRGVSKQRNERNTRQISLKKRIDIFRRLAYRMLYESQPNHLTISSARKILNPILSIHRIELKAEAFLKFMESDTGYVLEEKTDEYSFAHRTFQEFMAAWQINRTNNVASLVGHIDDSTWDYIITFYLYMEDIEPDDLMKAVLTPPLTKRKIFLAERCIDLALRYLSESLISKYYEVIRSKKAHDDDTLTSIGKYRLENRLKNLQPIGDGEYVVPGHFNILEYNVFMSDLESTGKSFEPDHWKTRLDGVSQIDNATIALGIRGTDAIKFASWLTRKYGKQQWEYRLPKPDEIIFKEHEAVGYWLKDGDTLSFTGKPTRTIPRKLLHGSVLSDLLYEIHELISIVKLCNSYILEDLKRSTYHGSYDFEQWFQQVHQKLISIEHQTDNLLIKIQSEHEQFAIGVRSFFQLEDYRRKEKTTSLGSTKYHQGDRFLKPEESQRLSALTSSHVAEFSSSDEFGAQTRIDSIINDVSILRQDVSILYTNLFMIVVEVEDQYRKRFLKQARLSLSLFGMIEQITFLFASYTFFASSLQEQYEYTPLSFDFPSRDWNANIEHSLKKYTERLSDRLDISEEYKGIPHNMRSNITSTCIAQHRKALESLKEGHTLNAKDMRKFVLNAAYTNQSLEAILLYLFITNDLDRRTIFVSGTGFDRTTAYIRHLRIRTLLYSYLVEQAESASALPIELLHSDSPSIQESIQNYLNLLRLEYRYLNVLTPIEGIRIVAVPL